MKQILRTLFELFEVMPAGAKRFFSNYSIATGMLGLLDSLALALIALTVTPLISGGPIHLPVIGDLSESATPWLILIISGLFVLKSVLAVWLHWIATRRFARYELEVGQHLFHSYTHSSWEERSRLSTAEVTRIVDSGMAATTTGFIVPLSQVPGSAFTFVSVLVVLVVAQPLTALIALVYLSLISFLMVLIVSRRAQQAGNASRKYGYRAATVMTEMVDALKELTLRGKLAEIGKVVETQRKAATRARANISFLSIVPKYAFEAALIGGFLLVGSASYFIDGPTAAVVSVSLFAATGFRMIPALTSLQSSFTKSAANEVYARNVITQLHQAQSNNVKPVETVQDIAHLPDNPRNLQLKELSFTYPGAHHKVLSKVDITIPFGSSLAIVGPSGAGKSTLVDLILGLSQPSQGNICIDDEPLHGFLHQWRSRVGYVPQQVALFDASIAQNVALTWGDDFDEERVLWALERAQLIELIDRAGGIDARLGERGASVSGGQKQRLGIARALYSDPLVLVLDEATSSLDTETENRVTTAMRSVQGETTFVTIAHRLATIRDYDQVCYLEDGKIQGSGSFDEVVQQVPSFALQAQLAGL